MSSTTSNGGSQANVQIVLSRPDTITAFPEGTFTAEDLNGPIGDYLRTQLDELRERDVLKTAGWEDDTNLWSKRLRRYRVETWARDRAHRAIDEREPICPCGHGGLSNEGDHYECTWPPCQARFARDQLEVER